MLLVLTLLSLGGCRCDGPNPGPPVSAPHFAEWDRLVRLAALGPPEHAQTVARDLVEGEVPVRSQIGREALTDVGAGLGAIQADPELIPLGIARTARGCGACHDAEGVQSLTVRPDDSHHTAAHHATWGLVWNAPDADVDGVATLLEQCAGCHVGLPTPE